jgi:hypothetical protein
MLEIKFEIGASQRQDLSRKKSRAGVSDRERDKSATTRALQERNPDMYIRSQNLFAVVRSHYMRGSQGSN